MGWVWRWYSPWVGARSFREAVESIVQRLVIHLLIWEYSCLRQQWRWGVGVQGETRLGETVTLRPIVGVTVAQDDQSIFESHRISIFVFLQGGNSHGWESGTYDVFDSFVFFFCYFFPCTEVSETIILFGIGRVSEDFVIWSEAVMSKEGGGCRFNI